MCQKNIIITGTCTKKTCDSDWLALKNTTYTCIKNPFWFTPSKISKPYHVLMYYSIPGTHSTTPMMSKRYLSFMYTNLVLYVWLWLMFFRFIIVSMRKPSQLQWHNNMIWIILSEEEWKTL